MNAHEVLTEQHRDIDSLYTEFLAATGEVKAGLAKQILTNLTVHAEIEEELYYPEMEKAGLKNLEGEFEAEHTAMKSLITKLTIMDTNEVDYEPTMKALMENVRHHVEEEETQSMPKMEALVNADVLRTLGPKLEARTKELKESTIKRLWAVVT